MIDGTNGVRTLGGRRALVTGAAGATGRAVVEGLVGRGAMVIAADASEDAVADAIGAIGLGQTDEVITRDLDEASLGSWWDLANLVAAYFHALDVLVHVPGGDAAKSMPMAIARLGGALTNAEAESPGSAALCVVADDALAASPDVLDALAGAAPGIPLHVIDPGPPDAVVARVLDRITGPRPSSSTPEEVHHA